MPKFPTYQRQVGLSGGATASYASAGAFTAPAAAIAGAGQGLQEVGAFLQRNQEERDDAWLAEAKSRALADYDAEDINLKAQSADGATYMDSALRAWGGTVERISKAAPSRDARRKMDEWGRVTSNTVRTNTARWRAAQEIAEKGTNFSTATQRYVNRVYADPSTYDQTYSEWQTDFANARAWMSPEQEAKVQAETERAFRFARARRVAQLDPGVFLDETGAPKRAYRDAIASIESAGSGDYTAIGPKHPTLGRALGRYQIMEANIGPWSQKHLGRRVTVDEFLANPSIQDAIFDGEFGGYVAKYGLEGAAQAWFAGEGGVGKTGRKDSLGTDVGSYGQKFLKALKEKGGDTLSFADDPRYSGLSYQEIEQLRTEASGIISTQETARQSSIYDQFDLALASGQVVTPDQIVSAGLDAGDQAKLLRKLDERDSTAQKAAGLNQSLLAGQPISVNQYDAESRKVGDAAYDQRMAGVPSEQQPTASRQFVEATGYVPKSLSAAMRGGVLTSDPSKLADALALADIVEGASPGAFGAMEGSADIQRKLDMFRHFRDGLALSENEAAKRVLDAEKPESRATREMLATDARKFVSDLSVSDVTNGFDTWHSMEPGAGINPVASNAMLAEYRAIAEEAFYSTGGNAEAARGLALGEMKRVWGVSEVSGDAHVMRLPPEKIYPEINGGYEYLREDALETAAGWVAEAYPERTVENVFLLASADTRRDIASGRPPRYRLFYTYEQDGQELADEVVGMWGIDAETISEKRDESWNRARSGAEQQPLEDAARRTGESRVGADDMIDPSRMHERFE